MASGVAAQDAPRPLASAYDAMRGGDWTTARALALRDGPAAADVIEWHRLRAGLGTAEEVMDFLTRNPDWPGLDWLRRKSETAISEGQDEVIRVFYAEDLPQTAAGALSYARAMKADGRDGAAEAMMVLAWRSMRFNSDEHVAAFANHADLIRPHHWARLDHALWEGWDHDAERMFELVDEGQKALAEARIALRNSRPNVDALIEAVPEALTKDAGLAFERFAWRARKGRDADAIELLLERSVGSDSLGRPDKWAPRRRQLAREVMRNGDKGLAYQIASSHYLFEGSDFADLEWLSGYLALRFLRRPDLAVEHFERFTDAVDTPISLGRGGYWLGRAHEAAGNAEAAQVAYAQGAMHQTSFYGLLAAEKAGMDPDPTLAGSETFPDWREAAFTQSSVYKAAILLLASGQTNLAERFFTHLAESQDRQGVGQMGDMLIALGQPHIQVMLGKRAVQYGNTLPGPYYALHPVADQAHPVPAELILSIARRESEFDQYVVSGAGARGLMQVMPGTAKDVAGELGLEYDAGKLLSDWVYNARLGAKYLEGLAQRFDGNVVMMAAGYNAGPARPLRWMGDMGDPRTGAMDVIDWIEHVPFNETRNYIMRVAESLPVYRARLGKNPHPVPFSKELVGSTLLPLAPEGE